jgi:flagellar hook-associated protein 3 FlgL
MIVNRSMFPLQTGFSVISNMQERMAELQMQLGTGQKSSTLAGMGNDLPLSLSVRSRLSRIEGYSANIETLNLRLDFLDNAMSRFDEIEGEARNSALAGQYGTGDINMATLPDLSRARFDEVVTLLNSDVAGRYLFGGKVTDKAPLPSTQVLLEGEGGRAGFRTVVGERKAADAGADGLGRLMTEHTAGTTTVNLTEDGIHPFGLKLSNISTSAPVTAVTINDVGASPVAVPQRGDTAGITFEPAPAAQIGAGQTVTLGFTLPDGGEAQIVLTAITAADGPANPGEFVIGADAEATAASFKTALDLGIKEVVGTEGAAASTFAAAENFFNGAGEPVLRVDGNPATATSLRLATPVDTVMWYSGESPAISAEGLGRLEVSTAADTATLAERVPVSPEHGFQVTGVSASTANIATSFTAGDPASLTAQFTALPGAGEAVTVSLAQPDGTTRNVTVTATVGNAGPGQFSIGATPDETAANFSAALEIQLHNAAKDAEGNPRQSVTAQIDDSTRAAYGVEANESGFLRMMRTLGSLSIETYPSGDDTARGRFDAMASRQMEQMSEGHNGQRGSVEIITMELNVALATAGNSAERHTNYEAQLQNLLVDVENVDKETVAMEILALQVRLQASYQVTAMVSELSLAKFI